MNPRPVQIEPGDCGREQLRQLLRLDVLMSARRARRQLSVHLLAAAGLPLLLALRVPSALGHWLLFCEQTWALLCGIALLLWVLELRTARQLARTLSERAPASPPRDSSRSPPR